MKIEFCLIDSGDIVFTKESKDLKDIINVITKVGTEIDLFFSKDDFIHGYVQSVMYQVNAESNDEGLIIYYWIANYLMVILQLYLMVEMGQYFIIFNMINGIYSQFMMEYI